MGNFSGKDDSGEMRDGELDPHHHQGAHGEYHGREMGPIVSGRPLPAMQPPPQMHHQQQPPQGMMGRPGGGIGMVPGPGGGMDGQPARSHMHEAMHVDSAHAHILSDDEEEDVVPTVFRWEHGGRQVYITGTFNNWERQIPMHRSGNDFTYIHNLPKGKHAFKFIVDDEWRYAPDQRTVADMEGRINNFIDVSGFKPFNEDSSTLDIARKDDEIWGQKFPDEEFTKEPPPLPPHLRQIILNKVVNERDAAALPVPQHVALDHLYCTAIKDGMMVLGVTERYRTKFFSTVYYSMMP